VVLALVLDRITGNPWLAGSAALMVAVPLGLWAVRRAVSPALSLFRALAGTALSYRDGDFSFGLRWRHRDELGDLVEAHNELGGVLREQRLALVQRELLLDTMVQNTPVAMLLVGEGGHVVYGNLAARQLLNQGRKVEGLALQALLQAAAEPLREAMQRGGDGLFSVGEGDEEDVYHLARRGFRLNGRPHQLLLLRQLTTELRRQEVQTWKKVIRVISHELNNSLAPVASLAHSGAELTRRGQTQRLGEIFATIEERARHLEGFIRGYAHFAKLPSPRLEGVAWPAFVERLRSQIHFALDGTLPDESVRVDVAQMEQALLNLLKNAHESGSAPDEVALRVRRHSGLLRIEVLDRGTGMNAAVLTNALVPFYSTKRSGTGLGLALAREIAEAHGGRISLGNREGGGLVVAMVLPVGDAG
jgi:nitrogen fixation/metabolism regulation signal transduction histidine kinase